MDAEARLCGREITARGLLDCLEARAPRVRSSMPAIIFKKKRLAAKSLRKRIGFLSRSARALGALSFIATTLSLEARAHADPERASLDWSRVLVEADQIARSGTDKMFPAPTARTDQAIDTYTQNATNTWFGVAPRMSFIARDWGATHRLFGDRLSVVDTQRLTRSARMVMWRVRLNDARFTPFAQLGLGQWRVDTLLLPLTPHNEELAGQMGGGFELRIGKWQIACENTVTAIYREQREANNIPQTRMWSTMLASKVEF
jgi:hypothetical protein